MSYPVPLMTPKQVYDLTYQREIAMELLPEGDVKVRIDLARLRMHAETLQALHKPSLRKPRKG